MSEALHIEWSVRLDRAKRWRISSADFENDAELVLTGDFASQEEAFAYAADIAIRLNAGDRVKEVITEVWEELELGHNFSTPEAQDILLFLTEVLARLGIKNG